MQSLEKTFILFLKTFLSFEISSLFSYPTFCQLFHFVTMCPTLNRTFFIMSRVSEWIRMSERVWRTTDEEPRLRFNWRTALRNWRVGNLVGRDWETRWLSCNSGCTSQFLITHYNDENKKNCVPWRSTSKLPPFVKVFRAKKQIAVEI